MISDEEGQSLIKFVRSVLKASFGPTDVIVPIGIEEKLSGIFKLEITLTKENKPRFVVQGEETLPLGISLIHAAKQFAVGNKVYDPISEEELDKIKINISIETQEKKYEFSESVE